MTYAEHPGSPHRPNISLHAHIHTDPAASSSILQFFNLSAWLTRVLTIYTGLCSQAGSSIFLTTDETRQTQTRALRAAHHASIPSCGHRRGRGIRGGFLSCAWRYE